MYWAPRPSDVKSIYEAVGYSTAFAYGVGAAEFAVTGGKSWTNITRANRMASFMVRSHWNAVAGVMKTPFLRGGSMTIGSAASAVAAGAVIGVIAGTIIARVGWGEEGQEDALDFYTFQVSPKKYAETLYEGFF